MRTTSDVTRVCVSTEINGVISVCGDKTDARAIYRGQFVCRGSATTGAGGHGRWWCARRAERSGCNYAASADTQPIVCVSVSVSVCVCAFCYIDTGKHTAAIQHQQLAAINLFL